MKDQKSLVNDIEEGEIHDQTIHTSIYIDDYSDIQSLTSQFQNLNETNANFLGTESKRKAFDPTSFQEVSNVKVKSGKEIKPLIYGGQKSDAIMNEDINQQNEILLNNNSHNQPNIIRNEDSNERNSFVEDKQGDDIAYQTYSQVQQYLNKNLQQNINSTPQQKQNNLMNTTNSSFKHQMQQLGFLKSTQSKTNIEEFKQQTLQTSEFTPNPKFIINNNNHRLLNTVGNNNGGTNNMKIATQDFAQLMRSKNEIYTILQNQGQFYLPPYQECTIEFLRDIFAGRKKVLYNQNVRIVNVPKLSELTVVALMEQVKKDQELISYLPEIKDKRSIINTIKPQFFPENIRAGLQKRKEQKSLANNKYIEIQSDLLNLLQGAVNLNPSSRGRALHLLNVGAKKRKRPERAPNIYKEPLFGLNQFSDSGPYSQNEGYNIVKRMKMNSDFQQARDQSQNHEMIQARNTSSISNIKSMIQPQTQNIS